MKKCTDLSRSDLRYSAFATLLATLPFKSTQMDSNETNSLTDSIDLISSINRLQIVSFLANKQSSRQDVHFLLKVLDIYFFPDTFC